MVSDVTYRRALIPLDGSAEAEAIIPFFLKIAGPLGLEVVLLRVLPRLVPQVTESSRQGLSDSFQAMERVRQEAQAHLASLADRLGASGLRATTMVREGVPATEILEAVRETGVDLIAMTTHGRSGLGRLLFGSVTEAVLRQAPVPVFVLRATEAQAAQRAA